MTFSANSFVFIDADRKLSANSFSTFNANSYIEVVTSFGGSVSGYASGGTFPPVTFSNTIDKFPFATDSNATDVGDLSQGRGEAAGQSSLSSGYTSGGRVSGAAPGNLSNVIDKFPFATNANASDVGDLTVIRYRLAGQSSSVSGYTSGGISEPTPLLNVIDKFPFATNANATDVGDLTVARSLPAGQSSVIAGYSSGGAIPGVSNVIDKFPFSTDTNATDVGDLTVARSFVTGQSSSDSGYTSGGLDSTPAVSNVIDKFPFSTDTNATDVGDLTVARYASGQSSKNSGYTSGGAPNSNVIDKFPFATNANATDTGDLTQGRYYSTGQQY